VKHKERKWQAYSNGGSVEEGLVMRVTVVVPGATLTTFVGNKKVRRRKLWLKGVLALYDS